MRVCLITLIMSLCISGCANIKTDSVVWSAQDVSFSEYQGLQILDIFNTSGKPISNEYLAYCTEQLKQQLKNNGIEIVEQRSGTGVTLRVQLLIVYFEFERAVIGSYNSFAGNAPVEESLVSMQIAMLDPSLSRTVAEIKNVTTYGSLGSFKLNDRKKILFRRIAEVSANEIAKLFQSVNSK